MAVLMLGFVFLFTLAVFRLLCFRTTLSTRTLATFLVLGSLLGIVALPVADKFFNSYRFDGNPAYLLLDLITQHLLLALPVLVLLFSPAWRNGASLADSFLVGAAIGLGYEFLSSFIGVMGASSVPNTFSFFPPGVVAASEHTVAGFGYWTGAVSLVCAASLRFFRRTIVAGLSTGLALLFVAADTYAVYYTTDFAKRIAALTLHGSLTAWLVLLMLMVCIVFERVWIGPETIRWPLGEIQSILMALVSLDLHEARRRGAEFRLKRQLENLAATARSTKDPTVEQQASVISRLLKTVEQPAAKQPRPNIVRWLKHCWVEITGVVLFAVLAFVLPWSPLFDKLSSALWTSDPFALRLPPFQVSLLVMLLLATAGWHFLISAARPFSNVLVDELARFSAERMLARLGLGIAVMALFYPRPQEFMVFQSPLATAAGLRVPGWNDLQGVTILLSLAWAASSLTTRRAEAWRKSSGTNYLREVLQNALIAFTAASVAWTSFTFFNQLQAYIHAHYGVAFFNQFKTNGNSIAEMVGGIITGVFAFGALWVFRRISDRMERFLTGAGGGPASNRIVAAGGGN